MIGYMCLLESLSFLFPSGSFCRFCFVFILVENMAESQVSQGSPYEGPVMLGILAVMIIFLLRYMSQFNSEGLQVSIATLLWSSLSSPAVLVLWSSLSPETVPFLLRFLTRVNSC